MLVQTNQNRQPFLANKPAPQQQVTLASESPSEPQDGFKPSRRFSSDDVKGALVLGGLGLAGAALGAYAGNSSGVFAGIAGAAAGLSGGASAAAVLPGEKIKTGAVLGALAGAIAGSSFGNPAAAVAFGVAGATLPFGAAVGLASMLSV